MLEASHTSAPGSGMGGSVEGARGQGRPVEALWVWLELVKSLQKQMLGRNKRPKALGANKVKRI